VTWFLVHQNYFSIAEFRAWIILASIKVVSLI